MAAGLDLGNLLVHLRADASQFNMIIGRAMQSMKRYAKYAAVAGAAQLTLSVREYAKFEEQMANVSTMLDEQTMKYMPAYGEAIKKMAMEFGEGTDTLSKGLYDILSASVAPVKAMKVLAVSAKAAKAGMTTTAIAADAITTVLNSYGMAADEAGKISDILFATVKRGKLTFAELAPNIGKVAAIASIANLSFEELSAAIATMTRAGLQADLATTALRAVMNAFIKPMDGAKTAAREFGFELNSATLKSIGLTGVLKKLKGATAEQLAAIMPNIRGMAGFAAALKQVDAMANDLELMLNSLGLTQIAYEKMTNTLMHTFRRFWQSIKITSVQIGSYLEPAVRSVTDAMIEWISAHQQEIGIVFIRIIQKMTEAVAKLADYIKMLPVFWTQFIIQAKRAQIVLYAVVDSAADLVRAIPWMSKSIEPLENEIDELTREIAELERGMDDMIVSFMKSKPALDEFFNTIITNLEKARWKLEWSIAWRDFNRGLNEVKSSLSPFVDLLDRMKGSVESLIGIDIGGVFEKTADAAKEISKELGPMARKMDEWVYQSKQLWERMGEGGARAFDKISDTLTELVMKGKADFASLARAILADIIQIQIRWQMAQAMMGLGFLPGITAPGVTQAGGINVTASPVGMQRGGTVERTGWAVVHKGEKFSGVNNEVSIGKLPNVIINNYTSAPIKQPDVSFDGESVIIQIEAALNDRIQHRAGPLFDTINSVRR